MNPQHISDLGSGVLQTIFVFVGPEDAIWSFRRVCKQWNSTVHDENLAKEWIQRNRFWKDDFTENDNGRIRHFKKSSSLWDYCFHRVTVYKFFQKCFGTLKDFWHKVKEPPSIADIESCWDDFHRTYPGWRLPWELFELNRVTAGFEMTAYGEPHCVYMSLIGICREWSLLDDCCDEFNEITFEGPDTGKWVDIGGESEYMSFGICCDPKHPNFGQISTWDVINHEGSPQALHLVELFGNVYWLHNDLVADYGPEEMKEWVREPDHRKYHFECLQYISGWDIYEGSEETDNDQIEEEANEEEACEEDQ